jgi:rhodanese-related sulfurtransferase
MMGFFNRFRKKDENAGTRPPASGQGDSLREQSTAAGRAAAKSEVAKSDATKAVAAKSEAAKSDEMPGITAAPQIKEVSAEELKARIDAGTAPLLIDVREPWEHQIANIGTAELIPMNSMPARMDALDKGAEIVVYCHHGQRSWNVAAYMMQHGFTNVKNLTGGIDSWARRVERSMRTY